MHARRAASEIERAIRGVTKSKGGRSSGQQARAGGLDFRGRRRMERMEASARGEMQNTQP